MESNIEQIYDVIIIGAGIAGSSAAYCLKRKKTALNLLVIEGRDRCGGRTQTVDMKCNKNGKTSKWDLGGQWVTDTQTNITRILKELDLQTYRHFDQGKKILESNGKAIVYKSSIPKISLLSLISIQLLINKINSRAKKLNTLEPFASKKYSAKLDSMNIEEYLAAKGLSKDARAALDAAVRTIYGAEMSQINGLYGLLYFTQAGGTFERLALSEEGCAQEKKVKGGTQQISKKLLEAVGLLNETSLLLNTTLVEVDQQEDKIVKITTKDTKTGMIRHFKARKVISSLPTNQYAKISFVPDLPASKRHVFKFCQMGNYIKCLITYEEAFWRKAGFSGEVVSDGSIMWLNDQKFKELNITSGRLPHQAPITCAFDGVNSDGCAALVAFIAGDPAVEWADMPLEVTKQEILHALERHFGQEANNYLDFQVKIWAHEEFTGGCPVCNVGSSGVMKDYVRAVREPFMNVHFCGTETATVWQGYMDGAVESGERAANEVLHQMLNDVPGHGVDIEFEKTYYYQESSVAAGKKKK